jgi:ABC-type nitrate/sulfonate/bicarbonate transport system substrate-binding protein
LVAPRLYSAQLPSSQGASHETSFYQRSPVAFVSLAKNQITRPQDFIDKTVVVEAFVRATTHGRQRAIEDPDAATRLTLARGTNLNPASEAESMRLALPLMNPAGNRPGMMTPENWQTAYQILRDQGLLAQQLDVQQVYTLTLLDKVYGK